MKKILGLVLVLFVLVGCNSAKEDKKNEKLSILATSVPHAEILEEVKPILKDKHNIELDIKITDDYYVPNKALDNGEVDANFFQHLPFLDGQIAEHGYKIENAGAIHIEPIGIYSKKFKSANDITDGSSIIISNSVADHGRILAVLENAGLIKLDPKIDKLSATIKDITENKKNLKFKADVDPSFLGKTYQNDSADLIAINSNYALEADLNPLEDAIILEDSKDNPYVNVVVVKQGQKDSEKIKSLVEVLKSKEIQDFILEKYQGSVVPAK